jgi:hypothetical protein
VRPYIITTTLIPRGSAWKYLDDGSNQGMQWRATNFNDATWNSGPARLGYGGDGEITPLGFGGISTNKYITYYFRRMFNVSDLSTITNLTFRLLRDDGAVIYLNSNEVYRSNMPGGTIGYLTTASGAVSGTEEQTFLESSYLPGSLRAGTNTLCVEIHQSDPGSSDLAFDLELVAIGPPPAPPRLLVTRDAASVRLAWPVTVPPFQLEYAPSILVPNTWTSYSGSITTTGNQNIVTTPATGTQQFFRLKN